MTGRVLPWWMLACVACASDPKSDAADASDTPTQTDDASGFSSSQNVGGLDPDQVKAAVHRITPEVDRCVEKGRKRLPILGGEVALSVTVGAGGRAEATYVSHSTMGDQSVERCIVEVFRSQQWPRPVGGKIGKIDQHFEFDSGEELISWQGAELERAMSAEEDGKGAFEELKKKLSECGTEAGATRLEVTLYLDEDGIAQTAGVASSDGKAAKAGACVETVVKTTSFPAPGRSFTKVTVSIP